MILPMILNELSFSFPAGNIQKARLRMTALVNTLIRLGSLRLTKVLHTPSGLHTFNLAPNYVVGQWLNDVKVDQEEKRYFCSLISKTASMFQDPSIISEFAKFEFNHNGLEARGLGIAYLYKGIALSLNSQKCWDVSLVTIDVKWITENGDVEAVRKTTVHASKEDHVTEHEEWIINCLKTSVHDGLDLLEKRNQLLPNLLFSREAERQLRNLSASNPMLRSVIKRLFEFNKYCSDFTGSFQPERLACKVSQESQTTLDKYGKERTFKSPNGTTHLFTWHAYLTPGNWRIYFDYKKNKILIGYIGPHLPTVKYPS